MGTGSNAAIVSVGAVEFSDVGLGREFYTRVDLKSSVAAGCTIDPSTVMWWLQQSEPARMELVQDGQSLYMALTEFTTWMHTVTNGKRDALLWGNGSDFDNVILASAYKQLNMSPPWKFYNNRCFRTLKSLGRAEPPQRAGTHHNALDDAKFQAEWAIGIFKCLNQVKENQ